VGSAVGKLHLQCFADRSEAGRDEVLAGVVASVYPVKRLKAAEALEQLWLSFTAPWFMILFSYYSISNYKLQNIKLLDC
jgi:hypothetical protein